MTFTSIDKFKFTATFLDDATSFGIMYLLKSKDQQFEAFKSYKAWAERQLNTTLKCIQSDRGTEFLNAKQKEYLAENGIEHQTSMPYSQQQNGRAERFQQTIVNKANSMRLSAGLSDGFWSYATLAAVHVYNRTPIIQVDYLTPYELWHPGQKPDVSHIRIFGCLAYVHILKEKRSNLQAKAKPLIFVGYEPGSKGYKFWDTNSGIPLPIKLKFPVM